MYREPFDVRGMRTVTELAGLLPATVRADEDPASLDRLADIVIPPPVPWWPPAPGWYAVTTAMLLAVGAAAYVTWRHRRRNAYRAAALAELERVGSDPAELQRIAVILKRTALATAPRAELAALNGASWVQWLNQNGNGVTFSGKSAQLLTEHLYGAGQASEAEVAALARTVRAWIRKHSAPRPAPPGAAAGDGFG